MLEQRSHELLVIRIDGLQRENAALRLHNQRLVAESERTTSERVALTELLQVGALRRASVCMNRAQSTMARIDPLCALQELEAMRTAIENQKVRHLQNELEMLHVMQVGTGSIGPRRLRLVRCGKVYCACTHRCLLPC